MAVRVETAEPRDLPAIMRLMRQLSEGHAGLDRSFDPSADWHDTMRRLFLERFGARDHLIAVARLEADTVGLITASLKRAPAFRVERRAMLENLVVDQAARRRGIATALVDSALAWCARRGVEALEISVACDNEAGRAFWDARGFRPVILRLYREMPRIGP